MPKVWWQTDKFMLGVVGNVPFEPQTSFARPTVSFPHSFVQQALSHILCFVAQAPDQGADDDYEEYEEFCDIPMS